jgi:hypothetical protein
MKKKGTDYFFWKNENSLYSWTVHTEKVACPLFYFLIDEEGKRNGGIN